MKFTEVVSTVQRAARLRRTVAAAALLTLAVAVPRGEAGDLATARLLYAEASYEEALKQLTSLGGSEDPNQIEQVRALCLLALGRTNDAERSLETIVTRSPLFRIDEAQVSPRLVSMFRDVRKRTLADAARSRYVKAKAAYDNKDYEGASTQFKEILAIAADSDASGAAGKLADMTQLAEGFLTLANAALAPAVVPAPAPAAPPPAVVPARPIPPAIYSASDAGVSGPVDVDRRMPPWRPPSTHLAKMTLKGILEVVIDEQGKVESTMLTRPLWAAYDSELLKAASTWTFRPATRGGKPVKFRKVLEIILNPPGVQE